MLKIGSSMLLLLLTLVFCAGEMPDQIPTVVKTAGADMRLTPRPERAKDHQIGDAPGVVVLTKRNHKDDFVRLYNEDGSLWHEFTFYDDNVTALSNREFRPFAFHHDNFVLALRCVGKGDGRFEVVVNEETGLKKYVRADDPVLEFETWEEHTLQLFSVKFDGVANPVVEEPGGRAKRTAFTQETTFRPLEVRGDWLKVRWREASQPEGKGRPDNVGWIKWREDGFLLIELFYFA